MAEILLDSIINDTIQNFRGHEMLESSFGPIPTAASINNQHHENLTSSPTTLLSSQHRQQQQQQQQQLQTASALDHIDSLTSLMQDVEMGQKERVFWVLLFSLMVLIAAGGNIIVIYIVSTNKEMKSVTNYFLVNLSLADTMVSTLNVIFNFISMLNSHWPFGKIYCKISNFIAILSISASVFTLTAISCDRYNAIIHPLRPRMSHRHALGWILLIWTLSSALALPNLIYSVVVEDRLINENLALTCTMIWPDGRYPLSSYDHIYNIVILVVTYLVPILTMAILYYEVGKELWGYEAIGENVDKQRRAIMAKKKIVKMMIVVVIMFALCWLPYHGFFVVNYYLPTIFQDGPLLYQRCYLIIYWLAMSNSMYEPIIIYFMNSNFRHEFRSVLWRICCCRTYTRPVKPGDINANSANSRSYSSYQATTNGHNNNNSNNNHQQQQQSKRKRSRTMIMNMSKSNPTTTMTTTTTTTTTTANESFPRPVASSGQSIEVIITQPGEEEPRLGEGLGQQDNDEGRPFLRLHDNNHSSDLNADNNNDKLIDFSINANNNNNDDIECKPKRGGVHLKEKVWI